jgi:glycosyltransferase involved in cell wall biosynthesis
VTLEREMAALGHRTTVAASEGSRVAGRLLATGEPASASDQYEARERQHSERILEYLRCHPSEFDLVHDESGSFFRHAAQCDVPMLATLHLPRSFYREEFFGEVGPNLYFNCVSHSQASSFVDLPNFLGVVQNGIAIERFPFCDEKQDYVLWMGRICEEKGTHLAIAAAREAGVPLVIAGQVYPFSYHRDYFEREVLPHVSGEGSLATFVDSPSFSQKVELLRHARAVLLTSAAAETSSLVAMEAMACGTPAIALRSGAFPEIVADRSTGYIVKVLAEIVAALAMIPEVSPATCRARAEKFFAASNMVADYEKLYSIVLARAAAKSAA